MYFLHNELSKNDIVLIICINVHSGATKYYTRLAIIKSSSKKKYGLK